MGIIAAILTQGPIIAVEMGGTVNKLVSRVSWPKR